MIPGSIRAFCSAATEYLRRKLGEQNPDLLEFQSLITAFGHLPARQETERESHRRAQSGQRNSQAPVWPNCVRAHRRSRRALRKPLTLSTAIPPIPQAFEELHELIKAQAFRLANWRVASDDINYRRFFDTNDLAGICVENEAVFEATHRLVLEVDGGG